MRHDDTIRTAVLLTRKDSSDERAAGFRQLVDLSLQDRECAPAVRRQAFRALKTLESSVPADLREAMLDKIGRQGGGALHLRLFRGRVSHRYDRLLQVAELSEAEWWRFARRAPRHLHSALLARRDLPGPVRELLNVDELLHSGAERYFVPDPALAHRSAEVVDQTRLAPPPIGGAGEAASPALRRGQSQIRELIDRIAAFRARTTAEESAEPAPPADPAPAAASHAAPDRWTWRCDEQAVFIDSPDVPRPLIGQWLTDFEAVEGEGLLRRALERRVPFRDLVVEAQAPGLVAGRWRMAGLPQFDRRTGRFTGYWGSAIALAPAAGARAEESRAAGLFGTGASSEALSTMAHEVRTPLNAIIGFAQLIEGEVLGNAGDDYRAKAGSILEHAGKLLGALDDLSDAARIEQGRYPLARSRFDPGGTLRTVAERYQGVAGDRGVALLALIAKSLPEIDGDSTVLERTISRLLTAALASAARDEAIWLVAQDDAAGALRIAVTRPRALHGLGVAALCDPAGIAFPDRSDAPILGIGFALKLVGSLVSASGGSFEIEPHQFRVSLPAAAVQESSEAS